MSDRSLTVVWRAADAREVFERAATLKAVEAAGVATVVELGQPCTS